MKKTIALLLTLCAVMIPFAAFADGNDYEGTGNSQTVELIGQPNSDSPSTKSVVVPGGTANLTAMRTITLESNIYAWKYFRI
ncbi:hypothetical protein [Clostridioides difficile]|uniref:hypothetical protein n=1 Tax=Clostridioides difficile TaxID=1496 RepID=UPI0021CDD122|nr:hypothetical protein [Clostridioides difficile]